MGTYQSDQTWSRLQLTGTCSFCAERPTTGYWSISVEPWHIEVCSSCAKRILPALLADSIWGIAPESVDRTARGLATRFWRALTLRLGREHRSPSRKVMGHHGCPCCEGEGWIKAGPGFPEGSGTWCDLCTNQEETGVIATRVDPATHAQRRSAFVAKIPENE